MRKIIIQLALGLLKMAYGQIAADIVRLVKAAQNLQGYTGEQKFNYVWNALRAKYSKVDAYEAEYQFIIETIVNLVKGKAGVILKAVR